jgi:hypothetical protein
LLLVRRLHGDKREDCSPIEIKREKKIRGVTASHAEEENEWGSMDDIIG